MSSSIAIPNKSKAASKAAMSSSLSSVCSSQASSAGSPPQKPMLHTRRPSLLGPAFSKARDETAVINIGDPEGPPRLIVYLSSTQGFAWNPELFVPSYIDCDYIPLENRRDPVLEIHVSDEEAKQMLPSAVQL